MEPITTRTPTEIGDISIQLLSSAGSETARFSIQVLDQTGAVVDDWQRTGNLVPYLDDSSTYLETIDRAYLTDLLDRIRQEAEARVLP